MKHGLCVLVVLSTGCFGHGGFGFTRGLGGTAGLVAASAELANVIAETVAERQRAEQAAIDEAIREQKAAERGGCTDRR